MFPISIKGVLIEEGGVVLVRNERDEWELPGGRLESGEQPETCLVREFAEELGIEIAVDRIVDCSVFEVLPGRAVVIVTYGVTRRDSGPYRLSEEHTAVGMFPLDEIEIPNLPEVYRRAIRLCEDG